MENRLEYLQQKEFIGQALENIIKGNNVVITGVIKTGKTTLLKTLLEQCTEQLEMKALYCGEEMDVSSEEMEEVEKGDYEVLAVDEIKHESAIMALVTALKKGKTIITTEHTEDNWAYYLNTKEDRESIRELKKQLQGSNVTQIRMQRDNSGGYKIHSMNDITIL